MHLHVALRPVVFLYALVFHIRHAKQGELSQGVAATKATTEEVVGVAEKKALVAAARQRSGDLTLYCRCKDLISIEKQHPRSPGRVVAQIPVTFFREMAIPVEGNQLSAMGEGSSCGGIGAG